MRKLINCLLLLAVVGIGCNYPTDQRSMLVGRWKLHKMEDRDTATSQQGARPIVSTMDAENIYVELNNDGTGNLITKEKTNANQKFIWAIHEKQLTVNVDGKKNQYLVSNIEKSSVTLHDTTMQPEQIVTFTKD